MSPKERLKAEFGRSPDKYYRVDLFTREGFVRKKCPKCGSHFWTLDGGRKNCPNPPCENYSFIGKPLIKPMDYIETWKTIEKFFVKNGHGSVPSYPVVCRWFPGLYFTVASIVAFQRSVGGKTVFEMPAERVIIPQVCLRFPDIENVGVTGRHMTNFTMVGQHSIYETVEGVQKGYWKDTCIDLDYGLLTGVLKIKPEDVTFVEDVWVGPNAFGYSLEYYTAGLELGNAVFTEFVGTPENYRQMDYKVIDMGAGLERFTWLSQGTPTAYDAVYGPVMAAMKKCVDFDEGMLGRYSAISGGLNIDEIGDVGAVKREVAKKLGISPAELEKSVEPVQAVYAIADHAKTILYALADGGLPSNTGGGYNLRVILRRALAFIHKYGFDFDLHSVCKMHADYLKPLNPNLAKSLPELEEILKVEESRYMATREKGVKVVSSMIKNREKLDDKKLIQLYESQGITPELISEVAEAEKVKLGIPQDFYQKLSERHMKQAEETETTEFGVGDLPKTKMLYYDDVHRTSFDATVLKVIRNKSGEWVVLDQTLFYPEGGGQMHDIGRIGGKEVKEARKEHNVIFHRMDGAGFRAGKRVNGEIDSARRTQLIQHHTGVHIINGAARRLLGNHVWQAGASKSAEKAHLDITHYQSLSLEEIEKIESMSNEVVREKVGIRKPVLPRPEAEKRYGMRLYQGGAIPDKEIRIVEIPGWDVEACAGTHADNTREAGHIVVTSSERIQDGVVRITIKAGSAANAYLDAAKMSWLEIVRAMEGSGMLSFSEKFIKGTDQFKILHDLRSGSSIFSVRPEDLPKTVRKFLSEARSLQQAGGLKTRPKKFDDMESALAHLFTEWKSANRQMEQQGEKKASEMSSSIIGRSEGSFIFEEVEADRKGMIKISSEIISKRPDATVILYNSAGDVIGMSREKNICDFLGSVCKKAGGAGGGRGELAQGKADPKELRKILEKQRHTA